MNTLTEQPLPPDASRESESLLEQLKQMDDDQKKEFLLRHPEMFAQANPWTMFFDEVVVKNKPCT